MIVIDSLQYKINAVGERTGDRLSNSQIASKTSNTTLPFGQFFRWCIAQPQFPRSLLTADIDAKKLADLIFDPAYQVGYSKFMIHRVNIGNTKLAHASRVQKGKSVLNWVQIGDIN